MVHLSLIGLKMPLKILQRFKDSAKNNVHWEGICFVNNFFSLEIANPLSLTLVRQSLAVSEQSLCLVSHSG